MAYYCRGEHAAILANEKFGVIFNLYLVYIYSILPPSGWRTDWNYAQASTAQAAVRWHQKFSTLVFGRVVLLWKSQHEDCMRCPCGVAMLQCNRGGVVTVGTTVQA